LNTAKLICLKNKHLTTIKFKKHIIFYSKLKPIT
jgi:hypothetical protein